MAVTLLDAEGKFTQAQIKPIIANSTLKEKQSQLCITTKQLHSDSTAVKFHKLRWLHEQRIPVQSVLEDVLSPPVKPTKVIYGELHDHCWTFMSV